MERHIHKLKLLGLSIFLLNACQSNTQTKRADLKKAISLEVSAPDSALAIYDELIANVEIGDSLRASAHYQKALFFQKQAKFDTALYHFKRALSYREQSPGQLYLTHRYMAWNYSSRLKFDLSLESHYNQLKVAEEAADSFRIGQSWLDVGKCFFDTQEHEKALEFYNKASDLAQRRKDTSLLNITFMQLGKYYGEKKNYDKAISYFKRGLESASPTNKSFIQAARANIAMCLMYSGQFDEVMQVYRNSLLEFAQMEAQQLNIIRTYRNIAYVKYRMDETDSAFYFFNKAQELSMKHKLYDILGNVIASKRMLAEEKQMYKLALGYQKEFTDFKDSLAIEAKAAQLEEIRSKYEEDKRVFEVQEEEKRKRLTYVYLLSTLILALFAFVLYYRRNLLIQRKNLELQELKQEATQSELKEKRNEIFDFSQRLQEKNRILLDLEQELQLLKKESMGNCDMNRIKQTLKSHLIDENARGLLEEKIEKANSEFFVQLKGKHPNINPDDVHLIGMLRLNFSSKQIAEVFNSTERAIEQRRYRLRKKLELEKGENLLEYIQGMGM